MSISIVHSKQEIWEKALPRDAQEQAKRLSFHYPSFIRTFKNGVAVVSWQLNPDGRYYMDEDGFGMTNDEEIEIYGLIDQKAKVIVKFRNIQNFNELGEMRRMAENIVKNKRVKNKRFLWAAVCCRTWQEHGIR